MSSFVIAFLAVAEQNVGICELEEENVMISPDKPINDSFFPPSECVSLILKATRTDLYRHNVLHVYKLP